MSNAFLSYFCVIKLSRRVDALLICLLQVANLPFVSNSFSTFKNYRTRYHSNNLKINFVVCMLVFVSVAVCGHECRRGHQILWSGVTGSSSCHAGFWGLNLGLLQEL